MASTECGLLFPFFFPIEHRRAVDRAASPGRKTCLRVVISSALNVPSAIARLAMTVMGQKINPLARVKEKMAPPSSLVMAPDKQSKSQNDDLRL